nr:retrovirus-related Pol polyprotein from transposon TNT 1-94 [Tanacetum cinerariifolium]
SKNKAAEIEEHHRNLLLSKNNKHISSACNNSKIDSQDVISKVVCAMCKKCLISVNHDKCLRIYVNGKIPRGKKQTAKVSVKEIQKNYQPKIAKPKKIGTRESLATPKPRKSRFILRWSPTGKLFDTGGKIVDYNESKSTSDCSNSDNACTSNTMEPKIKRFPNSTSLLGRLSRFVYGTSTQGTIELYFVKTDYQMADIFTKALPIDRFNYLVRRFDMRSLSPKEIEPGNPVKEVLPKLNLPGHRIRRWCRNLTPAESKFKTPMLDHQDKYMMKAQVHVSKSSAISDIEALPQRKLHC